MKRRTKLSIIAIATIVSVSLIGLHIFTAKVDGDMNPVLDDGTRASEAGQALHDQLAVVDLHADTLLWRRNPVNRHKRGHTDFPRLREGGVALQVFTAVTKSPDGQNYEKNDGQSDRITTLAMAQLWPMRTWQSIYERAAYQAQRLVKADRADANFMVVRNQQDLARLLQARQDNKAMLGGILGMEGAHPLEGELENIDRLYAEGYRIMGLQHFFDNALGGSLHGLSNEGLTAFGKAAVARAFERGMIIDIAHSSPQVVRDLFELSDRPMIISHTGIESFCDVKRNIPDDLLLELASRGGLIGIGYWEDVTCKPGVAGIVETILHGIETFGAEAIALGSDFDGTVTTPFDTTGLNRITDGLLKAGISEADIAKIMGGNALRFFAENLPAADE